MPTKAAKIPTSVGKWSPATVEIESNPNPSPIGIQNMDWRALSVLLYFGLFWVVNFVRTGACTGASVVSPFCSGL